MYINVSVVEVGKYSKDVEPKAYCGASGRCYMVYVYDYGAQLTVSQLESAVYAGFCRGRKTGEKLSKRRGQPTYSTHLWYQVRESSALTTTPTLLSYKDTKNSLSQWQPNKLF